MKVQFRETRFWKNRTLDKLDVKRMRTRKTCLRMSRSVVVAGQYDVPLASSSSSVPNELWSLAPFCAWRRLRNIFTDQFKMFVELIRERGEDRRTIRQWQDLVCTVGCWSSRGIFVSLSRIGDYIIESIIRIFKIQFKGNCKMIEVRNISRKQE